MRTFSNFTLKIILKNIKTVGSHSLLSFIKEMRKKKWRRRDKKCEFHRDSGGKRRFNKAIALAYLIFDSLFKIRRKKVQIK